MTTDLIITVTAPIDGGAAMAWGMVAADEVAALVGGMANADGIAVPQFGDVVGDWLRTTLPTSLRNIQRQIPVWDRHIVHPQFSDGGVNLILSRELTYDLDGMQVTITVTTGDTDTASKLAGIITAGRMIDGELRTTRNFSDVTPD